MERIQLSQLVAVDRDLLHQFQPVIPQRVEYREFKRKTAVSRAIYGEPNVQCTSPLRRSSSYRGPSLSFFPSSFSFLCHDRAWIVRENALRRGYRTKRVAPSFLPTVLESLESDEEEKPKRSLSPSRNLACRICKHELDPRNRCALRFLRHSPVILSGVRFTWLEVRLASISYVYENCSHVRCVDRGRTVIRIA